MTDIDIPFCVAANSHTIYLAEYKTDYNDNSGRPPSLFLYSSQQYPTSLSSIQWKAEAGSLINHYMAHTQPLSIDKDGYWCAVDDTGTFVIMSGRKGNETGLLPLVTMQGLLFDKPSKPNNSPSNGYRITGDYDHVVLNGNYSCVMNGTCNGHLYVLPTTPGSPSNFGFVTYNSTSGFSFETLDRTTKKFNTQASSRIPPVDHVREWDAFGYINNQLVAVSPQVNQTRTISLDARGQPAAGSPVGQFDVSAAADCRGLERGFSTSVNGRSYFSCSLRSKLGQYAMYSVETNSITKMAEYTGRTGDMLKGVIPVPNPNGGAPTWALAYNHRKNGLYGLVLSEEGGKWEEEIQESRRSSVIYGAVGGVAAVIVVILAVFFWRRKRNQKKTNMTDTHDTSHLDENNHPTSVDVNGMTLLAGNSEVKGDDHLPKIEDTPPLPLQQETLSQSQQPQFYPLPQLHPNPQYQPQPQPYTQSYLYAYPQQYPQPGPNLIQPHPQPFSSTTTYTVPITLPTLVPTPAAALTPTTATVVANSAPIEPVQQELQFSSHPRPNVVTTVSGAHP